MSVPRQTTDANVKFLRIGGDAPPPAAAPPAVAPATPAAVPVDPAAAVAPVAPAPPPEAQPAQPAAAVAAASIDVSAAASEYPGDDASQAEIGAWMAKMAQDRGLPPELPVMASLVESGMKNLNFGHADSVGFFQMRVGIWNQGEYAGYPEKPELQMKWFLDRAEAVKEDRLAAGKPIDDPGSFGEWVADIELPAEQYRYKYGTKLEEAQGILGQTAGPRAAPGAPPCRPRPGARSPPRA